MKKCPYYAKCYNDFLKNALSTDRDSAMFLHSQLCFAAYAKCARFIVKEGTKSEAPVKTSFAEKLIDHKPNNLVI
jgi:hypothetical protein